MWRIIVVMVMAGILLDFGRSLWAESSVKAAPLVKTSQKEGDKDAYIGPEYFPKFYKSVGEDACETTLKELSGTKMSETIDDNGFLIERGNFWPSKNCKYSCHRDTATGECNQQNNCSGNGIDIESRKGLSVGEDDYYDLEGLSGEIEISPGYEESAKALFTWTVRVEGSIPKDSDHRKGGRLLSGISVWPALCHPWHGTSYQDYEGGQVKTQLYIKDASGGGAADEDNYAAVGEPVEMTVPPTGKSKVAITTVSDPTLTGSYAVKPSDFVSGALPNKIEYRLKWANHTALRIKSPGKQRDLVATVMPLTQEK